MAEYYFYITQLFAPIRMALSDSSYDTPIPFLAAFVLGLVGAFSPCQLSTNAAAFAFISRDAAESKRVTRSALAYALGKVLVSSLVGVDTPIVDGYRLDMKHRCHEANLPNDTQWTRHTNFVTNDGTAPPNVPADWIGTLQEFGAMIEKRF